MPCCRGSACSKTIKSTSCLLQSEAETFRREQGVECSAIASGSACKQEAQTEYARQVLRSAGRTAVFGLVRISSMRQEEAETVGVAVDEERGWELSEL
jgi:hypothetical protein